jgi:hypothetical protein
MQLEQGYPGLFATAQKANKFALSGSGWGVSAGAGPGHTQISTDLPSSKHHGTRAHARPYE